MESVSSTSGSARNVGAWTFEEVQAWADRPDHRRRELEHIREVTVSHAQDDRLDAESRKKWAKLSLRTNARMPGDQPWSLARRARNSSRLRTLIIDRLGPDRQDPDWDPDLVASDLLAALTLTPGRARELSDGWQTLPVDRIGELRRLKNATAPLHRLLHHLRPGPTRDQAGEWLAVRDLLP